MEGTILHFSSEDGTGLIKDQNGNRYNFTKSDFKNITHPKHGHKVDFQADKDNATEIYGLAGANPLDDVMTKLGAAIESDTGQKISALFTSGWHNKLGSALSVVILIGLFSPIFHFVSGTLTNKAFGTLLFLMLIISTLFFYGGATRLYSRVLVSVSAIFVFYKLADILIGLVKWNAYLGGDNVLTLSFLIFGLIVIVIMNILLIYTAFRSSYQENPKSI